MKIPRTRFKNFNLADFIITRQRQIEIAFAIIFILSLLFFPFVEINYDLTKYLPADAPSKIGIDLMEKEFGYPGTARVMIDQVTLNQAKAYKDKIQAVDGVDQVIWADSKTDIYQGSQFLDTGSIENYYKNGYSIMDITFDEKDSSPRTSTAIDEIKEIVGNKGHMVSTAVQQKSLKKTSAGK